MPASDDIHDQLDHLLTEAVIEATGNQNAKPRDGQGQLSHRVLDAMVGEVGTVTRTRGQTAGSAPCGSGKSLSYGVPAAIMAVVRGERAVISTESLSLQAQLVDKDLPVVARAAERVMGRGPTFAVLKGFGNYACTARAVATAHEVTGTDVDATDPAGLAKLADAVRAEYEQALRERKPKRGRRAVSMADARPDCPVEVDGVTYDAEELLPLLAWALDEIGAAGAAPQGAPSDEHPADRHSYSGVARENTWRTVSIPPAECPGKDSCPFGETCRPNAARDRAARSDIVVTNHSMLAVQAANDVPVVIGSRRLGTFRHLVVDEAHALPAQVRSQGARSVSAFRVSRIAKIVDRTWGGVGANMPPWASGLRDRGFDLADLLDHRLSELASAARKQGEVVKLTAADQPLLGVGEPVVDWAKTVRSKLAGINPTVVTEIVRINRAVAQVESLIADVNAATEHEVGVARWVEPGDKAATARRGGSLDWNGAVLRTSPVDVAPDLRQNLYTADVLAVVDEGGDAVEGAWQVPEHDWSDAGNPAERQPPRYAMSVTEVSATLAPGFARDAGLSVPVTRYKSPFGTAFARSLLYVPRAADEHEIAALRSPFSKDPNRPKFDTSRHAEWAAPLIAQLVLANGGSALVLSATAAAGRMYAERLRAAKPGFAVHSQWDGPAVRQLVGEWREDHGSVLVGTRSLMTGTDAPGATCTLVIVDRVPRAAGNPVDDARVEAIMDRADMDKWAADRLVYVSDAALLLEQAAGRLVRALSDSGVVAVLDPRLLKSGPWSYPTQTRTMLMDALADFPRKTADLDAVLAYLRASREGAAA